MSNCGVVFSEFSRRWRASMAVVADLEDYGVVEEGNQSYPLLSASTPGKSGAGSVLITAGFHGDEKAGPLTLLAHGPEVADYARARDVALRIYPCINPSGFEAHTRYNLSGEGPNNDFLRYEVEPGMWCGELRTGQAHLRREPSRAVAKETAALRASLARLPLPEASLDLHQDNFIHGALFYVYLFGDRDAYRPLLARSGAQLPILRDTVVDSGYEPGTDVLADAEGAIECHDGSITDHYHRAGSRYVAAVETTTETPAAVADAINLIWIYGFIDLVAARDADPATRC
jgi:Succinylglutamate desuccinylase / Aspartoacylase family